MAEMITLFAKEVSIPPNSAIELIQGGAKIVLAEW